jgi:hypothetical protein
VVRAPAPALRPRRAAHLALTVVIAVVGVLLLADVGVLAVTGSWRYE